jgi:dGTPase
MPAKNKSVSRSPVMQWEKLFSTQRLGESKKHDSGLDRSSFERDFDRVVFSSAFRRLQDKTQVIPLPESDFVHSRLTHSLEVSCVGRSLGRIIGDRVIKKYGLKDITASDFGAVVASACLAHDIGNPPFGHSGEGAISNYFRHGNGKKFKSQIGAEKWNDLVNFEGNANGFRLLTNAASTGGGVKLTYTTLATFTKYPCPSTKNETLKGRASQKKYGYFQSEKNNFREIFEALEIIPLDRGRWCRHPLAFLVEAADDICYRIIDFEDGVRIGLIPFGEAEKILVSLLPKNKFKKERYDAVKGEKEKIGYLRALAINELIGKAADQFWTNETQIMKGIYDKHLTDEIDCVETLNKIAKMSIDLVYNSRNVLQIEASGFNVVAELLDLFITAVNDQHEYGKETKKEKLLSAKLIQLLPKQYLGENGQPEKDLYLRILQICEFVAGMTDTYAINLYKRLKGIQLPRE